jgi:predicted dehydrogenase
LLAAVSSAVLPAREPVPIAFARAGHSHGLAKVRLCSQSPDWKLLGVWEPDAEVRRKVEAAGVPVLSREAMLGGAARVIAVEGSVRHHFEDARDALAAGKHVHVEKPPADTMAGMHELAGLARRSRLLLQSGYMWRYHPGFDRIIEAVRAGWLGEVYLIRGQINTMIDAAMRAELATYPGGQMFELGSHLIDAVVRILGASANPVRVTPTLRQFGADGLADNTVAVIEYPRTTVVIQSASMQPGASAHRAFEVLGTRGTAIMRPLEPPVLAVDLAAAAGPYRQGLQTVELPSYRRYEADLADLAGAVHGAHPLKVSLDDEVRVHSLVMAASGMR